MIELGKRVKFISATALVQQLHLAKLQLELQSLLSKLDRYDLLIIDDLGYVKKSWRPVDGMNSPIGNQEKPPPEY
jgi:DNA replication protein DnaC